MYGIHHQIRPQIPPGRAEIPMFAKCGRRLEVTVSVGFNREDPACLGFPYATTVC